MTYPSVSNTLTSGTLRDAVQVNQNFSDFITSLSDGQKDIHVNNLILASGDLQVKGDVNSLTNNNSVTFYNAQAEGGYVFNYKNIGGIVHTWFTVGISINLDMGHTSFGFDLPIGMQTTNNFYDSFSWPIYTGSSTTYYLGFMRKRTGFAIIDVYYSLNGTVNWPTGIKQISGYFFYERDY